MRIIFSRKGFDTGSGGAPSPIIEGRPISLPIPTRRRSTTSYRDLGLGDLVQQVTRGRIDPDHLCHEDPMFFGGRCLFGQCGAAQSHLRRQGVGLGDVFLFFGLFADEFSGERHHRLFGYMCIESMLEGAMLRPDHEMLDAAPRAHPHTIGDWNANNCIYVGPATVASHADPRLRLTTEGGPLRLWDVPRWLAEMGLSYHGRAERWTDEGRLEIVSRGQEFVADIGELEEPRRWLNDVLSVIDR